MTDRFPGFGGAALLASLSLLATLPGSHPAFAQVQVAPASGTDTREQAEDTTAPATAADDVASFEDRLVFETVALHPAKTDGSAPPDHLPLTLQSVNDAAWQASIRGDVSAVALKAQILLDRAGFSPGAIDADGNANYRKALAAFQRENKLDASGTLDPTTWEALLASSEEPVLTEYEITAADLRGPFFPDLPDAVEQQVGLKRLGYRDAKEMLAEKFHMDQQLLTALNPQATFDEAGTRIVVARLERPGKRPKVTRIEVNRQQRRVRAYDKDGRLVASYPASMGSDDKPTPLGTFRIRRVSRLPVWHYNPRYAFKEIKTTRAFRLAAGPNNPLGVVWIGISRPSYGIHGTPIAEKVGTSFSHGCVRLTNWDVQALASMVTRRTVVDIVE